MYVAILIDAANVAALTAALNAATPDYTVEFMRKVAPIEVDMPSDRDPTHWYLNAGGVPSEVLTAWQDVMQGYPLGAIWDTGNIETPLEWGVANLAALGLQLVPTPE